MHRARDRSGADSSVNSPHTTTVSSRRIPAPTSWNAHIFVKDASGAGSES